MLIHYVTWLLYVDGVCCLIVLRPCTMIYMSVSKQCDPQLASCATFCCDLACRGSLSLAPRFSLHFRVRQLLMQFVFALLSTDTWVSIASCPDMHTVSDYWTSCAITVRWAARHKLCGVWHCLWICWAILFDSNFVDCMHGAGGHIA